MATAARKTNLPLITTECWGIVDFKDWPGLNWEIINEICETGVKTAAVTAQWIAIATSNFCGPQFVGMWRDVGWHQKLTQITKSATIKDQILTEKIKSALGYEHSRLVWIYQENNIKKDFE
ncbi:hypothetical protein JXA70_04390 [candidate division KSB1 bacterium]|nr:hypothetical protein [candidate division KSB1 bacterium]